MFCGTRCCVEDGQCYLLFGISVYKVFFRGQLCNCIPESGGKKFKGMEWMQPETICIASFKGTSSVFVCVLWHQTGAQYSAGAYTSAVAKVRKVSNEVPQLIPDSFLTSVTRESTFCFSLCKYFLYVGLRSREITKYVGYRLQFMIVLGSKVTLMDFETRWFLRWNSDDTVFDWESF